MSINKAEWRSVEDELLKYLTEKHFSELNAILENPDISVYHSLRMHGHELLDVGDILFTKALVEPIKIFKKFDEVLAKALDSIYSSADPEKRQHYFPKSKLHLRISALPTFPVFQRQIVPKSDDVGR